MPVKRNGVEYYTVQEYKTLQSKVRKLQKELRELKAPDNSCQSFEYHDCVLAALKLPNKVSIEVCIQPDTVQLVIGPRDFTWDKKTGELTGVGTILGSSVAETFSTDVDTQGESTSDFNSETEVEELTEDPHLPTKEEYKKLRPEEFVAPIQTQGE